MQTDKQRLEYLLSKDNLTPEEKQWMQEQLQCGDNPEYQRLLLQLFSKDVEMASSIDEDISRRVKEKITRRLSLNDAVPITPWWLRRAVQASAAAIILIISGAYFFFPPVSSRHTVKALAESKPLKQDVAPGGQKAVLTLSDGSQIILDSASNGMLTHQGNTTVTKLANGQLTYNASGSGSDEILYNTMRTPRGGQYRLTLPDGTQVWLNAESSITYPTSFTGADRHVSITGEAYFEVARITDQKSGKAVQPFKVKVNEMTVEVLGTHFNINAYGNESVIKTTLLEGSVKIWERHLSGLLKPGEQSRVNDKGELRIIKNADLEETMAWKNGIFYFTDADIQSVMRQLMRWYDVDVIYEGKIPEREFQGEIQKDLHLSQVLNILGKMEVNFRIEGKNIIVMQ